VHNARTNPRVLFWTHNGVMVDAGEQEAWTCRRWA